MSVRQPEFPAGPRRMLESSTGAGICTALAMLDNFTYPADIFPSSRFYTEDLAEEPLELVSTPKESFQASLRCDS